MATRRHPDADQRDEMRRLRAKNLTVAAIGARLGFSKSAVHRAVADMAVDGRVVANRERASIPPLWLGQAKRLIRAGLSRNQVARKLKIPTTVLYRAMEKFG